MLNRFPQFSVLSSCLIAAPDLTDSIRKVLHDFPTVGAASPLQQAGVMALSMSDEYFDHLSKDYAGRRDMLVEILQNAGFVCFKPGGAYYVMTDISQFGFANDVAFARHLVENVGVAAVPGSSFYGDSAGGARQIRFCFCKKFETLEEAGRRLRKLS